MRHEYRIRETRYHDGSGHFRIEIRKWYWPFWKLLEYKDHFAWLFDYSLQTSEPYFRRKCQAEDFALKYANEGNKAFILNNPEKEPIYLGRLP